MQLINHLSLVYWSTFWKYSLKWSRVCKFDIMTNFFHDISYIVGPPNLKIGDLVMCKANPHEETFSRKLCIKQSNLFRVVAIHKVWAALSHSEHNIVHDLKPFRALMWYQRPKAALLPKVIKVLHPEYEVKCQFWVKYWYYPLHMRLYTQLKIRKNYINIMMIINFQEFHPLAIHIWPRFRRVWVFPP